MRARGRKSLQTTERQTLCCFHHSSRCIPHPPRLPLLPPSLPPYVATGTYPGPCPFRRAWPTQGPFSLQWSSAARPRSPTDITGRNDVDAHCSCVLGALSLALEFGHGQLVFTNGGSCRAGPAYCLGNYSLPATRDLDLVLLIRFVVPFSAPTSCCFVSEHRCSQKPTLCSVLRSQVGY